MMPECDSYNCPTHGERKRRTAPRVTIDRAENGWLIQAFYPDGPRAHVALEHDDAVELISRLIAECARAEADA